MKKTLILMGILIITASSTLAANTQQTNQYDRPAPPPRITKEEMAKREAAFEQRLGLTEAQKQQAKDLRVKGHEQMKPIMENLMSKKQEAHKLRQAQNSANTQNEQLTKLNSEIQELEKQAREVRKANMKDFEAILNADQKKTLKEMKQEGRQKYHKNHPGNRPPMGPRPDRPTKSVNTDSN